MGSRRYSRQTNGRFRRATLENTFGLTVDVCPSCRRLNPRKVGEAAAENCHACDAVLRPTATCGFCDAAITLLADHWTDEDGITACADTSAPYVPHKPAETKEKLIMLNPIDGPAPVLREGPRCPATGHGGPGNALWNCGAQPGHGGRVHVVWRENRDSTVLGPPEVWFSWPTAEALDAEDAIGRKPPRATS